MKISAQDILELSSAIKSAIDTHEVPDSLKNSLLQDVIFSVSSMVDSCQGSNIHESIFQLLETYQQPPQDYLVCELFITLKYGEELEANILLSDIERNGNLKLNLEVLLELRDISEIDKEIDCESKFKILQFSSIYLQSLSESKIELPTSFTSLEALEKEIRRTAKKWV